MNHQHTFTANLKWNKTEATNDNSKKIYTKNHIVEIEGKPDLAVSAAKSFKGDPSNYNPEDLLLTSLMSCHMMSYLYVCQLHSIDVISYQDNATAALEIYSDGSGKIIEVILNPIVIIRDNIHVNLAITLHQQANKLCFIANSCNFPVIHHPKCSAFEE